MRIKIESSWVKDILSISFLLLIFYTLWLGSYPLFTPDEGRYSEIAREMVANGDYITPKLNGIPFLDKPILYYWLQTLSIHLFGLHEFALRLFPALLGIAGCIMTYTAGRFLFNRLTGLLSSLILATAPLYFGAAHYANLDLEVAVFISTSLFFWIMGAQAQKPKRDYFLLASYAAAALAFLTKGLIALVFPVAIVGTWLVLTNRWSLLKSYAMIIGPIIFLAIVLPWYLKAQQINPDFFHYFFVTQHFSRFLSSDDFNNKSLIWFYFPIVIITFMPWTVFLFNAFFSAIKNSLAERKTHTVEIFLLLWVGIIFIFFSIPKSKIITYILPIYPALALLTGRFIALHWAQNSKKLSSILSISFMILTCLFIMGLIIWASSTTIPAGFTPYLVTIIICFALGTAACLLVIKRQKLSLLFAICFVTNVLFLLTLVAGIKHLNTNSAKPLVQYIQSVRKPNEEVIAYYRYFYDVPVYLDQPITIVADWQSTSDRRDNWRRELSYGMDANSMHPLLINDATFWQRWNGDERIFVFLNDNYFGQFKEKATSYFQLGRENNIILLSNRPTVS